MMKACTSRAKHVSRREIAPAMLDMPAYHPGIWIGSSHCLTPAEISACEEHARGKTEKYTAYYASKRNQGNPQWIYLQVLVGKMGEIGFYKFATSIGLGCTQPDISVYDDYKDIGWTADMVIALEGVSASVAVKTAHYKQPGGALFDRHGDAISVVEPQMSFMFNASNNDRSGGNDSGNCSVYVFCTIDDWHREKGRVTVNAALSPLAIDKLVVSPFKNELRGIKKCLMLDSCGEHGSAYPCGIRELLEREGYILDSRETREAVAY